MAVSETAIKLDIKLNSKDPEVYVPGATVEGNVVLELLKQETIHDITITFSGEARTRWTTYFYQDQDPEIYSDTEVIFNNLLHLVSEDEFFLPAGIHKYPFQLQLPTDHCPSSFQSKTFNGVIKYWLTATVLQPSSIETIIQREVIVNEIVDVNIPELIKPLSRSNEKTVHCLCCTSGPISLSVTTDKGGYFKGESIGISIQVENRSRRRVTVVRASLIQEALLIGKNRTSNGPEGTKFEKKPIQSIEGPGIRPGGTCTWDNKPLLIPVNTTPTITSCRFVKLSYYLTVTLALLFSKDLHVEIPIEIGNTYAVM